MLSSVFKIANRVHWIAVNNNRVNELKICATRGGEIKMENRKTENRKTKKWKNANEKKS